jgi:hypothetical protein
MRTTKFVCSLLGVATDSDIMGPRNTNSSVEDVHTKIAHSSRNATARITFAIPVSETSSVQR